MTRGKTGVILERSEESYKYGARVFVNSLVLTLLLGRSFGSKLPRGWHLLPVIARNVSDEAISEPRVALYDLFWALVPPAEIAASGFQPSSQ